MRGQRNTSSRLRYIVREDPRPNSSGTGFSPVTTRSVLRSSILKAATDVDPRSSLSRLLYSSTRYFLAIAPVSRRCVFQKLIERGGRSEQGPYK